MDGMDVILSFTKINRIIMTNNKQQTAVEWLYNELLNSEPNILEWNKSLEQAKAMQKQQAEHYATFITNCVINNLPTITFNDWINLHNNEQQ